MPITISCPHCQKRLQAPESVAGRRAKCPKCQQVMQVPELVVKREVVKKEEAFEDLGAADPFGDLKAPGTGVASGGGLMGDLFSNPQFDELLADAGPRIETKPKAKATEADRFPCPVCHELIARGASKCRYCGENFNQFAPPRRKKGTSPAARSFNTCMYALGGIWIALGALGLALFLIGSNAASSSQVSSIRGSDAYMIGHLIGPLITLFLGIATCRKAIWAVWIGLVLNYIGLVLCLIGILVILLMTSSIVLSIILGICLLPTIGIILLAQRCIYWNNQIC